MLFRTCCLLLFWFSAFPGTAQPWGILCPKLLVTNDITWVCVGINSSNDFRTSVQDYGNDPKLSIQFFVNGVPNNIEQPDPNGAILSANYYDGGRKAYNRRLYYRAPSKMPDKNPVEIKVVITPAGGPPITATNTIMIVAEKWSFQHFQALRYKCYEGGNTNPKNSMAIDMGMATGNEQRFHFKPQSTYNTAGELEAELDGDPDIYYAKTYDGGTCDPTYAHAELLWGDDDQTHIKNVKVRFDGTTMKVDYVIDYMNYLGWAIIDNASGKTLLHVPRRPGSHDVKAGFEFPLKRQFRSLYTQPKDQQVMLHSAGGVQVRALE